jgi:hypothetical protein
MRHRCCVAPKRLRKPMNTAITLNCWPCALVDQCRHPGHQQVVFHMCCYYYAVSAVVQLHGMHAHCTRVHGMPAPPTCALHQSAYLQVQRASNISFNA